MIAGILRSLLKQFNFTDYHQLFTDQFEKNIQKK